MTRLLLLVGRALLLRCPHCGAGGVLRSWFHLRERCSRCGLALERHEGEDYFLGGMMLNIALSELAYAGLIVSWIVLTWPAPPWNWLQYVGIPFMMAAPFVFYPLSKTAWLAFDLWIRPARADDLAAAPPR